MKISRVRDIILPYRANIPLHPRVSIEDRVTHAIRKMIESDVRCIAVMQNNRPVGVIRFEDALDKIGVAPC